MDFSPSRLRDRTVKTNTPTENISPRAKSAKVNLWLFRKVYRLHTDVRSFTEECLSIVGLFNHIYNNPQSTFSVSPRRHSFFWVALLCNEEVFVFLNRACKCFEVVCVHPHFHHKEEATEQMWGDLKHLKCAEYFSEVERSVCMKSKHDMLPYMFR